MRITLTHTEVLDAVRRYVAEEYEVDIQDHQRDRMRVQVVKDDMAIIEAASVAVVFESELEDDATGLGGPYR